jgi:acyl-CoA synthetase (AMP-forming)/AMP-acid ligase II
MSRALDIACIGVDRPGSTSPSAPSRSTLAIGYGSTSATGPDDALLAVLPLGHNFPLACPGLQGFLQRGARLVLSETTAPADNAALIAREGVTHLELVPALLIRWLNDPAFDSAALATVRVVNTGGHRLQPEVKRRCEEMLPACIRREIAYLQPPPPRSCGPDLPNQVGRSLDERSIGR